MQELAKALVKAQSSMNHAAKDSKNPHFKSAYSSLASVIDAVRPHLAENGLAFVQKLGTSEGGIIVETVLIHESGQELSCGQLFVPATKQDAQGYGSAISYGKRYSLQAALGIASEDDDGNAATKSAPVKLVFDGDKAVDEMNSKKTLPDLQAAFAKWYKIADVEQRASLQAFYEGMKEALQEKK
ncbi:erf superfamily [Caudoviricetes sp.]|nr:erf superfamily [Caudoviricetes sp.]